MNTSEYNQLRVNSETSSPVLMVEETTGSHPSSHIEEQRSEPQPSWRQVLKHEFDQLRNNEITIDQMDRKKFNHFRKLIESTMGSFISLVIPLTFTFILVVMIMTNLPFFKGREYIFAYYTPIEEGHDDTSSVKFGKAILNSLIFCVVVVVQTIILVLLYKYKFYKVIGCLLRLSIFLTLFFLTMIILVETVKFLNVPMDAITCMFILFNYTVLGIISIFTDFSIKLQQFYHIISSALLGCLLIRIFPEWTGWIVLGVLVFWDLFAVLSPIGPLKIMVELAQERNEILFPALVFSTGAYSNRDNIPPRTTEPVPQNNQSIDEDTYIEENSREAEAPVLRENVDRIDEEEEEEEGEYESSRLGLGDFVFFSILIGKASLLQDLNVIFYCYIALIFGFYITFMILLVMGQALPALPVSLVIGLIMYFSSAYMVGPMFEKITMNHLII